MADVSTATNFFPTAQEGFTTTTSGTVSSGAATVGLNSVAGYANGAVVAFVIDPTDLTKKQAFTGVIDTSGVQVTGVKWTEGTNVAHSAGATVVDYETATAWALYNKGLLVQHSQDGTHHDITSTNATFTNATVTNLTVGSQTPSADWTVLATPPGTVVYNGNRSYTLTHASVDYTNLLNAGTRYRTTRTVAAPTQCTSLNGTTQYYSKSSPAGMTFTDDFVVSAWVKLTSYAAASIVSRYNGTSGFDFGINALGQLQLLGYNGGAANVSYVNSYQSLPLNKWVHVTAQLDMSSFTATTTTSYTMIDGVDTAAAVARTGTNPTALIQAGNLEVGSRNGGTQFFPGKIAQAAVFNAKVTQATIRGYISQGLAGTETSLISAYSFNNSINDLNANANNLTANGSAVATNADSPFGTQSSGLISSTLDYAIVQSATFSTNTTLVVQVPEGCTIPTSGGVSAVSYSGMKAAYGFPGEKKKWVISTLILTGVSTSGTSNGVVYNPGGLNLNVPAGSWDLEYQVDLTCTPTATYANYFFTLSTSSTAWTIQEFSTRVVDQQQATSNAQFKQLNRQHQVAHSTATPYYPLLNSAAGFSVLGFSGNSTANNFESSVIKATNGYL